MSSRTLALTVTGTVTLRDYQETAVADIRGMFQVYRRVLFVLPTGGGKTIVFTYITERTSAKGRRVIIVAHRKEICRQISKALTVRGVPHGCIMPGHAQTDDLVQVAMIQTLVNRLDKIEEPALLVIDEAHHSPAGSWEKVKQRWRKAHQLGVSATPERLDGKGLGGAFDAMVQGPTPGELIQMGNLAPFLYLSPPNALDLSKVHTRGGDYVQSELEAAMDQTAIVGDAVAHYRKYLAGKTAVAFCISIRHAKDVAARFRAAGIAAASVDGNMTAKERDGILGDLEAGRIKVVTSCDLISEGFDVPAIAGAILLRPTKSLALFLQQCGRALRPKPDGSPAVILDHVGNAARHGLPDWAREWSLEGRKKKKEAAQISVCKLCFKTLPSIVVRSPSFACGGIDDEICPFKEVREGTEPREIEEVDGELVDAREAVARDPLRPDWAYGLHLQQCQGRNWFRLLDLAGTDPERLKEIEKARGYKRGWWKHQLAKQYAIEAEVGDFLDGNRTLESLSTEALWPAIRAVQALPATDNEWMDTRDMWVRYLKEEYNERKAKAA